MLSVLFWFNFFVGTFVVSACTIFIGILIVSPSHREKCFQALRLVQTTYNMLKMMSNLPDLKPVETKSIVKENNTWDTIIGLNKEDNSWKQFQSLEEYTAFLGDKANSNLEAYFGKGNLIYKTWGYIPDEDDLESILKGDEADEARRKFVPHFGKSKRKNE